MKYTKEKIEQIFNVIVIALVGTTRFVTVKKEECLTTNKDGHRVIDTSIYYGVVDLINGEPVYNCTNSDCYWYDIDSDKVTKLC